GRSAEWGSSARHRRLLRRAGRGRQAVAGHDRRGDAGAPCGELPNRFVPRHVLSQPAEQDRRLDGAERELARGSMSCVESIDEQLRKLLVQRQALRERGAGRDQLESNRLELASRQRELSQAPHRSSPFPRRARGSVMFARSSRTGGLPGGGARRRSLRLGGLLVGCVALALAMLTFSASAAKDDLDLVSRATGVAGAKGNADSLRPAISGDGRFVAFDSSASNLAADDGDIAQDVFVRDLQTNTTTVVSRASGANGVKGNDTSLNATLSS